MHVRLWTAILLALFIPVRAASAESVQKWTVDGVEREGLIFAPESAKTQACPLVFVFHGHGGNMRYGSIKFRFQELWPEAIVIYLQGLNTPGRLTDPDGKLPGWQMKKGVEGDRDLKLFDAVLKWSKETYKVDDKRIYATGHSNGGGFTYLLWAERGDVLAAVAPASSAAVLKGIKPKPVLHIGGLKDPLVKFEWQKATIASIREINGCKTERKTEGPLTVYSSETGTPLETYIYDGGHTPPPEAWAEAVKFFKETPGK